MQEQEYFRMRQVWSWEGPSSDLTGALGKARAIIRRIEAEELLQRAPLPNGLHETRLSVRGQPEPP